MQWQTELYWLQCHSPPVPVQIVERGHAYAVEGGDVFFSVPSSPGYGQLSGRKLEENRAGERVEVDARKKHPADFALWKVRRGRG